MTNFILGLIALLLVAICYQVFTLVLDDGQATIVSRFMDSDPHVSVDDSEYVGGPIYDSVMESKVAGPKGADKERYAVFIEREIMMNRVLPRRIGPAVRFMEVNYRHKDQEMDYTYSVIDASFEKLELDSLNSLLQKRYCQIDEFSLHRKHGVKVNWIYWSQEGQMLHKLMSMPCI